MHQDLCLESQTGGQRGKALAEALGCPASHQQPLPSSIHPGTAIPMALSTNLPMSAAWALVHMCSVALGGQSQLWGWGA